MLLNNLYYFTHTNKMKNISIWQDIKTKDYPSLKENIKTDILIIGGGITGVNLLYALKNDSRKVALVEKNKLGMGITSKSTAKITFLQQNIYSKLKNNFNEQTAYLYYNAVKEAIENIVQVINKEKISCDLKEAPSFLYALNEKETAPLEEEKNLLHKFGEQTYNASNLPNGVAFDDGFYVKGTYVFHPLKYVSKLAIKSLTSTHEIYENTNILKIENKNSKYYAYTKDNVIECNTVVLACHYPYFLVPYLFPLKSYLEKSYIMAVPSNDLGFSAINITKPLYSFRFHQNYIIALSNSHNLCHKYNSEKEFQKLIDSSNDAPDYIWSNHDIMTLDNLPYIGKIKDNMYLATGYNTWGMTGSFMASILLKDLLNNKKNILENILSPKRGISKDKLINEAISIWSSSYSFLNSKINLNKKWYYHNPYFITIDNHKIGVYTDENHNRHLVKVKCPHLGCSLYFNNIEKTWECPCHGSVFDIDGKNIIGPSNYDISYHN